MSDNSDRRGDRLLSTTRVSIQTFMPRKIRTSPRKLPQQERSKVTVDAILIAAAHILTENGYDNASTNRIAERAGVSISSLYQYFPNKEAIMTARATLMQLSLFFDRYAGELRFSRCLSI